MEEVGGGFLKYKKSVPARRNHRTAIKRVWANQIASFVVVVLVFEKTSALA